MSATGTSPTTRQRIILTYSARLTVALHRHVQLNPSFYTNVRDLTAADVRRILMDSMSSTTSPYATQLGELDGRRMTGLLRAIVRQVEDGEQVRRNYWAGRI